MFESWPQPCIYIHICVYYVIYIIYSCMYHRTAFLDAAAPIGVPGARLSSHGRSHIYEYKYMHTLLYI